jgi:hypothetical protein
LLRRAFSRLRAFLWFATAVAIFPMRTEMLGVTTLVRALNLDACFYNKLVDHFHSPDVQLDRLAALWAQTVLSIPVECWLARMCRLNPPRVKRRVADAVLAAQIGRRSTGLMLLQHANDLLLREPRPLHCPSPDDGP